MNAQRTKFLKSIAASKVLTPAGEKLLSEIKVGDIVIGADDNGRLEQRVAEVRRFVGVHNTIYINEIHAFAPHQSLFVFRDGKKIVLHAQLIREGDYIYTDTEHLEIVSKVENIKHPLKVKRIALELEEVNPVKRFALKLYHWFTKKPKFNRSYFLDGILVHNASRFWVGGTGNWDGSSTTHWAATSGGSSGASVPTVSDTVTFDSNSGTSATVTITGSTANSSATTINKSDLTLLCNAAMNVTGSMTLTTGTLNTNGQICTWGTFTSNSTSTRSITLSTSSITLSGTGNTWVTNQNTGMTFSGASSTLTFTGSGVNFFATTSQTYGTVAFIGTGTSTISSPGVFTTLTRTGTAAFRDILTISANVTTTTLNVNGFAQNNRLFIQSNAYQTPRTITAATVNATNVDFQDITGAGAANWNLSSITGFSGDAGGNSGITFTTSQTQNITMSSSTTWSDLSIWSSRMPLPQDDVTATNWTGGSITVDVARMGRNLDFTSTTSTGNLSLALAWSSYGDWKLSASMTTSGGGNGSLQGASSHTIIQSGKSFGGIINIQPRTGGSYQLGDALTGGNQVNFSGSITSNNYNITGSTISISGTTGGSFGTSIITCTSTAATTVFTGGGSATTSGITIIISSVSANTRVIAGAGGTYKKIQYTISGSTGGLDISGSNTYLDGVYCSDPNNARTLRFVAGTTQTAANWNGICGTAGKLITVDCTTAASFNIAFTGIQGTMSTDYVNFKNTVGIGTGANYFAGPNSTDGGGNTNIQFKACPICSAFMNYF